MLPILLCFGLLVVLTHAQSSANCTTLAPAFALPANGTSTIFASTTTTTSTVNCRGCSIITSTFAFSITDPPPSPTTTTTLLSPPTTSTIFSCSQSISAPPGATVSFVPSPAPAPSNTTAPVPPLSDEATSLINDLKTVTLYASLIANGGFSDVLCSAINPTSLGDGTGINGTAVLSEICFTAAIQAIDPPLYPAVVKLNQEAVATKGVLETALFAVEAAAGYGGVTVSKGDLGRLYREIDEVKLGNLFIGFKEGRAKDVSGFVGRAAGVV